MARTLGNPLSVIAMLAIAGLASQASAGGCYHGSRCGGCYHSACGPAYQTVEKTVYVPHMVTEKRIINVTQYRKRAGSP
jgi:hypothetical protein